MNFNTISNKSSHIYQPSNPDASNSQNQVSASTTNAIQDRYIQDNVQTATNRMSNIHLASSKKVATWLSSFEPKHAPIFETFSEMHNFHKRSKVASMLVDIAGPDWIKRTNGAVQMLLCQYLSDPPHNFDAIDKYYAISPIGLGSVSTDYPQEFKQAKDIVKTCGAVLSQKDLDTVLESLSQADKPQVLEFLLRLLPNHKASKLTHFLVEQWGLDGIKKLSLPVRQEMLRVMREGIITDEDADVYDAINPGFRKEVEAYIGSSDVQTALQELLVASDEIADTYKVSLGDYDLFRTHLPTNNPTTFGVALIYKLLGVGHRSTDQEFEQACTMDPVITKIGDKETTTPYQRAGIGMVLPGFGNSGPSAAWLAYMARHFEKGMIVAFNNPGKPGEPLKLERMKQWQGHTFPDDVQIYSIGSPKKSNLSYLEQSDLIVNQLDTIMHQGKEYGLHGEGNEKTAITMLPHSQAASAILLAQKRLDAAKADNLFSHGIIGLAPNLHGVSFIDNNPAGYLFRSVTSLFGGKAFKQAATDLEPDIYGNKSYYTTFKLPDDYSFSVVARYLPKVDRRNVWSMPLFASINGGRKLRQGEPNDGWIGPNASESPYANENRHLAGSNHHFDVIERLSVARKVVEWLRDSE